MIKPSQTKEFSFDFDLNYDESFVLSIILSMSSIKKEELAEIIGHDYQIDKILFRLAKQGSIVIEEGYCSIKPEAMRSVEEFLKKLRLVW